MSHWLDVVVSQLPRGFAYEIVGSSPDAFVVESAPDRADLEPRKTAVDVRTGASLPRLPAEYAPIEKPPAELTGGAAIRAVKAPRVDPKAKAIVTIELRQPSGDAFVLASRGDAVGFAAGNIGGALYTEHLAAKPDQPHTPKRDTRRLVLTLARTGGPIVTFPLPWWVAAMGDDARRLCRYRVLVCLRARVLCIEGFDMFWLSLDALDRLMTEAKDGAQLSLRGVVGGTSTATKPYLYTTFTVVADAPAEDPVRALAKLLGWAPEDAKRDGRAVLLHEPAAAALVRALR